MKSGGVAMLDFPRRDDGLRERGSEPCVNEAEGGLLVFVQGGDLQVSFPLTMVFIFPSV